MTDHILLSSDLNEVQNHDDFQVVWFGSRNYVPKELKNVTDYLHEFYSFEEVDKYLNTVKSERKILVVLTSFFEHLSYFNDSVKIHSIYILNKNEQNMKLEKEKYLKLIHIFNDELTLIERLRQDILLTYNDLSISTSYMNEMTNDQSLINFDRSTLFIWNQLFTYYLVHSSDTDMEILKQVMIKQCRLVYQNNQKQLDYIDDFDKNCTCNNALEWYTKDSFVYRLVNKAFRTRNVDLICKFRFFIILLHNQLKDLSKQQQGKNDTTVYRGQILGKNELKSLQSNVGCLISTNTIMSASRNEDIAREFAYSTDLGVLFEINITNTSDNTLQPFADISQFSLMLHEQEILFFTGAVFHVDSVTKKNESTWIIKLTLTNEKVELIEQLMNGFEKLITTKIYCGDLLKQTDDYSLFNRYHRFLTNKRFSPVDIAKLVTYINLNRLIENSDDRVKAIEYYQQLLSDENFIDHPKFIVLHIIIGINYFHLKQYDNALDYYNIAFEEIDENNRLKGEVYHHIGDVWRQTNDYESALSCYEKALQIINNYPDKYKNIDKIYRIISDIYLKQDNYDDAIIYQNQANEIDEYRKQKSQFIDDETSVKHEQQLGIKLDSVELQHAHMLYTTGMHLVREGQFDQGLQNLLKAEKLFKNLLPIYDLVVHKLAKLYEHAAVAYVYLNDKFNALIVWKKAIDIRKSFNYEDL